MQTYPLKLSPAAPATVIQTNAALFVYESGVTTPDGKDFRIVVKPDAGQEIVLKPGQRFRLEAGVRATNWNVRLYDKTATVAANVIIGAGDFDDANTQNTFKLDATFANQVYVTNDMAAPVPVVVSQDGIVFAALIGDALNPVTVESTRINNTTAQRIPVSLDTDQIITTTSSNTMAYTTSSSSLANTNGVAVQLVAPAENTKGIILSQIIMPTTGAAMNLAVLAKASAPANMGDGDMLDYAVVQANGAPYKLAQPVKIPAGRGVYVITDQATNSVRKSALYVVL